jgi:hypothetical protein
MGSSPHNLRHTLDESSQIEDNLVELALDDSDQLKYLLEKYSVETSELENCIAAHIGYTDGADVDAIKVLQENMEKMINKMQVAQVKMEISRDIENHDSAHPDPPSEELKVLIKLSYELSELVSNFRDEQHQQQGEQRIEPDLEDPEINVQHRIGCIRKLLCKNSKEFSKLLNSEATAIFQTFIDVKSKHIALFQRDIGWSNRVYVRLLKIILAKLVPHARQAIESRTCHLEKLTAPPPEPPVQVSPFLDWFADGESASGADSESSVIDYSGYGIGRFNDDGWETLLEIFPKTARISDKARVLNLRCAAATAPDNSIS